MVMLDAAATAAESQDLAPVAKRRRVETCTLTELEDLDLVCQY
jgi:hypothetical protein